MILWSKSLKTEALQLKAKKILLICMRFKVMGKYFFFASVLKLWHWTDILSVFRILELVHHLKNILNLKAPRFSSN